MGACTSSKYKEVEEKDEKRFILTPQDVTLIKNSWKAVVKGGLAKYGTHMMIKIFLEHKDLKPLWKFARNLETEEQMNSSALLKAHGEKLFNAIDMAVNSLDDLNTLVPVLIQLGYSHCRWGVKEEHFQIIGAVLISTLQDAIKEGFTPKVKKAWIKVYGVLEAQMKIGMKQYESEQKAANNSNTTTTAAATETNQVTLDMTNSSIMTTTNNSNQITHDTTTNMTRETDLSRENGHVKNGFIETTAK